MTTSADLERSDPVPGAHVWYIALGSLYEGVIVSVRGISRTVLVGVRRVVIPASMLHASERAAWCAWRAMMQERERLLRVDLAAVQRVLRECEPKCK